MIFNIKSKILLSGIISLMTFLSGSIYAQDNLNTFNGTSNEKIQVMNTPQDQNDTELVMSILKNIAEKGIKETDKKIEFVNTFKVSNDIKDYARSLIKQGLNYSDYEKNSYGYYVLKKCHDRSISKINLNRQICYADNRDNGHNGCFAKINDICCIDVMESSR